MTQLNVTNHKSFIRKLAGRINKVCSTHENMNVSGKVIR